MMQIDLEAWPKNLAEATLVQKTLAPFVDIKRPLPLYRFVAAADVSFNLGAASVFAAVVIFDVIERQVTEYQTVEMPVSFPYVPGYLSFREIPPLLRAWEKLEKKPDVLLCDGQGIAHPRRFGIASHLGVHLGIPTVGCAKSLLCGRCAEVAESRGNLTPILYRREIIGYALRTRARVSPVYVSPGHLCDFESAVKLVLATTSKYRLPDPLRAAHSYANKARIEQHHQSYPET